jgi:NADH-quinone oxidoreductase subunit A
VSPENLAALAIYGGLVLFLVVAIVAVSAVLGERHRQRATGEAYESGIVSTGSARLRFAAHFYLVALLFVIFDLEAAFLFAWAVAARDLGWAGCVGAAVFLVVLGVALLYEWRVGALDFGPSLRPGASTDEEAL